MLVVTSNWCIPDGSLMCGPAPRLVDRVRAEVRRACLRAGVGVDGRYSPVPGVAIVCAGDTFDWLTSVEWAGDVRPWESGRRAAAARERVAARSLRHGGRFLGTLATWARRGLVVPAADRRGRPLPGSTHRLRVQVSLLRGDRDRWIDGMPVPAEIAGIAIGTRWSDGAVTVRHGEELEPPWSCGDTEPTLGESLGVELLARFAASLAESSRSWHWGPAVVRAMSSGRLADAPVCLVAALDALVRTGTLPAADRECAFAAWNRAVSAWHRAARRLGVGRAEGVDVVDDVASALTLSSTGLPRVVTQWSAGVDCPEDDFDAGWGGEILGHPPAGCVHSPPRHDRLVCIGPQPLSEAAGDRLGGGPGLSLFDPPEMISRVVDRVAPATPSVVAVRSGPSRMRFDWLHIASGSVPPNTSGRGVWRSPPDGWGRRVVDAA